MRETVRRRPCRAPGPAHRDSDSFCSQMRSGMAPVIAVRIMARLDAVDPHPR